MTLLEYLVEQGAIDNLPLDWASTLLVKPMDDGGMGSLLLFLDGEEGRNQKLGKRVSEYQFKDVDNVDVIASLNIDKAGKLLELDIWKTDFSALISMPDFSNQIRKTQILTVAILLQFLYCFFNCSITKLM